jgi:hypothetical protein
VSEINETLTLRMSSPFTFGKAEDLCKPREIIDGTL